MCPNVWIKRGTICILNQKNQKGRSRFIIITKHGVSIDSDPFGMFYFSRPSPVLIPNFSLQRRLDLLLKSRITQGHRTTRSALYTTNIIRINSCIKQLRITFSSTGFTISRALVHLMLRYQLIFFTECIRSITGPLILCPMLHHIRSNRIHLNKYISTGWIIP